MADVPPEYLAEMRGAGRLSWVSAVAVTTLSRCYAARAGEAAVIELWQRYAVKSTELPLFGPLFHGATRLFGIHPGAALRVLGQAWGLNTRDFGTVEVEVSEDQARVRMRSIPVDCRHRVTMLSLYGVIRGTFEATRREGDIASDVAKLEAEGWYELHVAWRRSKGPGASPSR